MALTGIFTLWAFGLGVQPAHSEGTLLSRVKAHYSSIETLQADFVQETRSTALGVVRQEGKLRLERPNKMRWDFQDARAFVGNGETLWMYNPSDRQVIRSQGSFEGSTSASLLQSLDRLDLFFEVSDDTPAEEAGLQILALTPKETGQFIGLTLYLDEKLQLKKVESRDVLGGTTVLTFANLEHPADIDDDVFDFTVPDGVRVIDAGSWSP